MSTDGVKLADVAREAGVHPSTVSRVLSRPQLIGEPTRAAVQAAIDRLGYVPNRAARQLAGGRTGTIGVLVPDITNPYFACVVRSVQRRCGQSGYTMLLADTDQSHDVELSQARALAPSVDGFIVCTPIATTTQWRGLAGAKPLVFVNRRAAGVAWVVVDQPAIVELGVQHLRAAGHDAIAVVRGPAAYWSSRQRDRMIRSLDGVVAIGPIRPDYDAGVTLADELLAAGVTGVVAFNDQQALGIIAGVRAAGRSVPGDLSVVGSDDIDAAAMSTPPLTTVTAPMQRLGETAFAAIDQMLGGSDEHVSTSLPVTMSIRDSTAPPSRSTAVRLPTTRSSPPNGHPT
ncbi:LacI family DNA-binding transcriptional regulator [Ilumatobacter nonamiensis]|uniref:LacI family DNA-binding transcriptional regulator n=1 Tax=Ilumatobacter nonamiensis TaxID=467093 RepID=UPI00034883A3|nr:LacI family DNA-binding transcriptional regulator [Ilumatobacter nonamiensis]